MKSRGPSLFEKVTGTGRAAKIKALQTETKNAGVEEGGSSKPAHWIHLTGSPALKPVTIFWTFPPSFDGRQTRAKGLSLRNKPKQRLI